MTEKELDTMIADTCNEYCGKMVYDFLTLDTSDVAISDRGRNRFEKFFNSLLDKGYGTSKVSSVSIMK